MIFMVIQDYPIEKIQIEQLTGELFSGMIDIWEEAEADYMDPISPPMRDYVILKAKAPPWPNSKTVRYLWIDPDAGKVLAYGHYSHSLTDNKHFASIHVRVKEEERGYGVGKHFFMYILKNLPTQFTKISVQIKERPVQSGYIQTHDQYLLELGGKLALHDRRSGSNIKNFDLEEVKTQSIKLLKSALEKGYTVQSVEDYEFVKHPEIDYEKYVVMLERIWNDMPKEQSEMENETLNAERHQQFAIRGRYTKDLAWTFVVNDSQGDPIGLTETWINPLHPEVAFQDDTGILHEHRGNGLGLMLKYQMLYKLLSDERTTQVKWWTTHNAGSNAPMLRINDILQYKTLSYYNNYEFDREELEGCIL